MWLRKISTTFFIFTKIFFFYSALFDNSIWRFDNETIFIGDGLITHFFLYDMFW
ncbi:unknown protein [Simkania negevensis Z]|uniref:Uncharacterized protein n=1 Tax=Simkania negevensis (strain ATCC VR-1471 / DSM 27360 / Z) TaxID=331113 RepID=F8L4S6_SIMNZ|nr:unknown protein [Simkania negevensis Z]